MRSVGLLLLCLPTLLLAQRPRPALQQAQNQPAPAATKLTYTTVEGDPLSARFYTLPNGLTVILSVNKGEPRIFTSIAVKAGSKYDPADNTGLAHYLEHMLFKGTAKFGSNDWAKEQALLNEVERLYNQYNNTRDEAKRKVIYRQIDSVSGLAAKFAIPNEYDKMLSLLGATGTNAFTSNEMTVYINDIPSNEVERWLRVESERFQQLVLRLFHTELEAVYEEKNISLDNDARRANEVLNLSLYPTHPYGTQTTIGTVEHLKNPNWGKIKDYFNKYYVPNNMAVILAGDFDPDATIQLVAKYFGTYQPKPIPAFTFTPEKPITKPIEHTVSGPDQEFLALGYRLPGKNHPDALALELAVMLLYNGEVGLMDLNLNQQQKVLESYAYLNTLIDYSTLYLNAKPRQGQTLEQVRDLVLAQLEKLRKGEFDETQIQAIVKNKKIDQLTGYENNRSRAMTLMYEFVTGSDWKNYVTRLDRMAKLTKADVVAAVNKHLPAKSYVVVYKKNGPKDQVVKIEKPAITPVELNRDQTSPFVQNIIESAPADIQPEFLDFDRDLQRGALGAIPVLSVINKQNQLFRLYYYFEMGGNHDRVLPLAVQYLEYAGTARYSPEELKKKFYALGCRYSVSTGNDATYVRLEGLQENFAEGVALLEELLANAKPDQAVLDEMIAGILKDRDNAKKNKNTILFQGLMNYAMYGEKNPFTNVLSIDELRALKAADLTALVAKLSRYEHQVLYYGPLAATDLVAELRKLHPVNEPLVPIPAETQFEHQETPSGTVLHVDYDMVQAQLLWLSKSKETYNPKLSPTIALYNEYFGGNMSSIVFQTIRESKALAYSTNSRYTAPRKATDPYYNRAFVGTQADKLQEAYAAMQELLNEMPQSDLAFETARKSLLNSLSTERTLRQDILFSYLEARRLGLDRDIRADIFRGVGQLQFSDIQNFQREYVSSQPHVLLLLGSKNRIKPEVLQNLGTVRTLTLEEIFGY